MQSVNQSTAIAPGEYRQGAVTVLEVPEDEFYFLRAFRPSAFELEGALPPFVFNMAFVYVYTLFETYLAKLIRLRLSDREAGRLMREPILDIAQLPMVTRRYGGVPTC